MFERRLRVFFSVLVLATIVLALRAADLQLRQGNKYREESANGAIRPEVLETTRGSIVDFKGRKLAVDEACIDAAVDFRAIARDPKWMEDQAKARLKMRSPMEYAKAGRAGRTRMIKEETGRVSADIDGMWRTLAQVGGQTLEQIEEIKSNIQLGVEWRRRYLWYMRYEKAAREHDRQPPEPWFKEWMLNGAKDPELDSFRVDVGEQFAPHVILHHISGDDHNRLKKQLEHLPGLVLTPGKFRYYPYGQTACHILGRLSTVTRQDLDRDPNAHDYLRAYHLNDVAGRDGVEGLCDQALRGVRGLVKTDAAGTVKESSPPVPGREVRLGIDVELQKQIEQAFTRVDFRDNEKNVVESHEAYGAAVVMDLPTGQVRALVSYPTYDLNRFAELYPLIKDSADPINRKMLNRATQMALEPGSTVKPMVGIGAITDGLFSINETIECRGYLYMRGKKLLHGRCWVATYWEKKLGGNVAHHPVPWDAPHPTGHLTFPDALQRSCNVFFENVGDRMGVAELAKWFRLFGLGRKTGIGLPESAGRVPDPATAQYVESIKWYSAIGQTQVLATPLQMANVMATVARNGIWMRPHLLVDEEDRNPPATTQPAESDMVDLHLDPAALAAAKVGLNRVVNTRAGTGNDLDPPHNLALAGKTGSAQAARFQYRLRQPDGTFKREVPPISTIAQPNPQMRWYRGSGPTGQALSHAWFIGYVPADKPRLAIAVMLEYGGSGGGDSAPIVRAVLDACVNHGYLQPGR